LYQSETLPFNNSTGISENANLIFCSGDGMELVFSQSFWLVLNVRSYNTKIYFYQNCIQFINFISFFFFLKIFVKETVKCISSNSVIAVANASKFSIRPFFYSCWFPQMNWHAYISIYALNMSPRPFQKNFALSFQPILCFFFSSRVLFVVLIRWHVFILRWNYELLYAPYAKPNSWYIR